MEYSSDDLLAVIYSEFDNHVGPQLRYCYPNNVVTKDHFEVISDYVILEKHLCEQLILITIDEWKVLIISIAIENPKYERNSLTFSFGFVLSHLANHDAYGKVLKRIVATFVDLEIESEFLFQKQTKQQLLQILPALYQQLKNHQTLFLLLSSQSTNQHCLALQLYQTPHILFPVEDYDVPIFAKNHINLAQLPYDIAFQYLILSIDGISHVKKIIQDVNMDDEFVKRGLSLLVFYQVIVLTDIFKFSNMYQVNNDYGMILLYDQRTHQELEDFLFDSYDLDTTTTNSNSNTATTHNAKKLHILPIIDFVLNIQPGKTIGEILLQQVTRTTTTSSSSSSSNPNITGTKANRDNDSHMGEEDSVTRGYELSLQNIDIARLIAFIQMKGIIRRIHEFPFYVEPKTTSAAFGMNSMTSQSFSHWEDGGVSSSGNFSLSPPTNQEESRSMSPPLPPPPSYDTNSPYHAAPSIATTNRPFQKLSRSKTVIGRSFVKDQNGINGTENDMHSLSVQDILGELDGTRHLDDLCSKYDLNYFDVVNYPGVQIIYR